MAFERHQQLRSITLAWKGTKARQGLPISRRSYARLCAIDENSFLLRRSGLRSTTVNTRGDYRAKLDEEINRVLAGILDGRPAHHGSVWLSCAIA